MVVPDLKTDSQTMLNRRILVGIKTLHTVIFLGMSAAILYILYSGLTRTYNGCFLSLAAVLQCVVLSSPRAHDEVGALRRLRRGFGFADIFLPAS